MNIDATDSRITAIPTTQSPQQDLAAKPPMSKSIEQVYKQDTDNKTKTTDKVTIQLEIPKNTLETIQKVSNVSELLVSTAKNIRKTDEALSAGASIVAQMKEKLSTIIKQFPPFPPESKERMELLMSYSSLQKQITSLMVPPPPPPVYEKVQHLWDNLFPNQSITLQTPQLPVTVPESHIKTAAEQLNNVSNQVGLIQETMGNSVKGI